MTTSNNTIPTGKYIARIVEEECIGCTLCIKACPFDAIIGASKHMHTVISHYCTGCKLCIPPCPVDCIKLDENVFFKTACQSSNKEQQSELKKSFAEFSRHNKTQRSKRLNNIKQAKQEAFDRKKKELLNRK